jgi:hypothetical protein
VARVKALASEAETNDAADASLLGCPERPEGCVTVCMYRALREAATCMNSRMRLSSFTTARRCMRLEDQRRGRQCMGSIASVMMHVARSNSLCLRWRIDEFRVSIEALEAVMCQFEGLGSRCVG